MRTFPKQRVQKHSKGQEDHIDAWLMSYADMITLLFMFFVIIVSAIHSHNMKNQLTTHGEPPHPVHEKRNGLLTIGTVYDEIYPALVGIVVDNNADRNIAVEKTVHGLEIDMSSVHFFKPGTAEIPEEQLPLLKSLLATIVKNAAPDDMIEVEGYTDDTPLQSSKYANNWELAAMQATRIITLLIEAGADPARLHALSYAGNNPVVPNADAAGNPIPENRDRNQRVVLRMQKIVLPPG